MQSGKHKNEGAVLGRKPKLCFYRNLSVSSSSIIIQGSYFLCQGFPHLCQLFISQGLSTPHHTKWVTTKVLQVLWWDSLVSDIRIHKRAVLPLQTTSGCFQGIPHYPELLQKTEYQFCYIQLFPSYMSADNYLLLC